MNTNNKILTQPEWYLMEPLWKHHRQTGREAVEYLKESVGWSRSTSLTMLRRMTEKGYVRCVEENGLFVYYPLIRREEAARRVEALVRAEGAAGRAVVARGDYGIVLDYYGTEAAAKAGASLGNGLRYVKIVVFLGYPFKHIFYFLSAYVWRFLW